jgi:hypothetical protein
MMEIEDRFAEFRPLVDALVTERLVEFYNALIERGQISPPPLEVGVTADCTADAAPHVNQIR